MADSHACMQREHTAHTMLNSSMLTKSIYMRMLAVKMTIITALKCTRLKLAAADSASRSQISGCSDKRSADAILETFSGDCCSSLADKTTAYSVSWPPSRASVNGEPQNLSLYHAGK